MTVDRFSATWTVTAVTIACLVGALASAAPAIAATKPVIGPVALYANSEFRAVSAVAGGAMGVAICVSGRCVQAFEQRAGFWTAPATGLPLLRRGQRRQVVIFAVNATGQFAYATTQTVVR